MTGSVLTLNAGSSSLKFALFDRARDPTARLRGAIQAIETAPHLVVRDAAGKVVTERSWPTAGAPGLAEALGTLLDLDDSGEGQGRLAAVGHRVVHGGADHINPETITPALLTSLEALTPLAPLHMPANLALMRAVAAARPDLAQVACFDTAFHHTMPAIATQYALPHALSAAGVRRYGFHGLSYEHVASALVRQSPVLAQGRTIVAHLGAGASLCALQGGRSIATTTGFSALDGLVMATRCGSLDPGVIFYLGRRGHSLEAIEDLLYRQSGLLGVSGISGDIRVLLASDAPAAQRAIALFVHRIVVETGALVAALGGLDGLVFTAGIGEHAAPIRAAVCVRLAWLGLRFDPAANATNAPCISVPDSAVEARIVATDEEAVICRHTQAVIDAGVAPR